MSNLSQHITSKGSERYRSRFADLAAGHFRLRYGVWISSIGLGTHLGENTPQSSDDYIQSIQTAVRNGCNLIDTAINYRMMQSERDIRAALAQLFARGEVQRDELLLCSKGGYIPYDGEIPENPLENLEERFYRPGIVQPGDVAGHMHCIAPDFLSFQIESSLENLGLETIDVYYLHNPETQLGYVSPSEFLKRLRTAFIRLEEEVAIGHILAYGIATWNGLRVDDKARDYLPLQMITNIAHEIAGEEHHFRFVQFPYNLGMLEALNVRNQHIEHRGNDGKVQRTQMPLLAAAYQMGIATITSAGLQQTQVLGRVPAKIRRALGDFTSDAQYALQFNRSTPGVTATLVGMGKPQHALENMAVANLEPLNQEEFFARLSK
jgi:aryl-alcohol dehydrogenase-like predicted oxidoreductase